MRYLIESFEDSDVRWYGLVAIEIGVSHVSRRIRGRVIGWTVTHWHRGTRRRAVSCWEVSSIPLDYLNMQQETPAIHHFSVLNMHIKLFVIILAHSLETILFRLVYSFRFSKLETEAWIRFKLFSNIEWESVQVIILEIHFQKEFCEIAANFQFSVHFC